MARAAKENVREKILEAAERRLWHYGFKKTTIDEIAADVGVGKGTIYLYFDSKEDIGLAIIAEYKIETMRDQEKVARNHSLDSLDKVRQFLKLPIIRAQEMCNRFPDTALEIMMEIKPRIGSRMRPYFEQEVAMLATVLEEGNERGVFQVDDTLKTARSLKLMTLGFLPPFPFVHTLPDIEESMDHIVDTAFRGLRKSGT